MVQTARYIGQSGAQGIKLHLLHVLRGTDLAADYAAGKFEVLTPEHYIDLLEQCLCVLPPEVVIHRLTGDGAKRDLIAPLWSADKSACSMRSTQLSRATIWCRVGTVTLFQVLTMRRETDFIHGICEFCRRMDSAYPGTPKDDIEVKLVEHISCREFLALRVLREICVLAFRDFWHIHAKTKLSPSPCVSKTTDSICAIITTGKSHTNHCRG